LLYFSGLQRPKIANLSGQIGDLKWVFFENNPSISRKKFCWMQRPTEEAEWELRRMLLTRTVCITGLCPICIICWSKWRFYIRKSYIFHKLISIKIVGFLCARLRAAQEYKNY